MEAQELKWFVQNYRASWQSSPESQGFAHERMSNGRVKNSRKVISKIRASKIRVSKWQYILTIPNHS